MSYLTQSLKLVCICPTSSLLSRLTTAQVLSYRWLETTILDSTGLGQSSDCRRTNANSLLSACSYVIEEVLGSSHFPR